ncbi:MAG TPA: hypothetical protein V6C88_14405 [Chroococcidiopsis sp.]
MAGFSDYAEGKILDHVFGAVTYTPPATLYIALFTTTPNVETGASGTEVTGGNYSRVAVTNNATNWPAASGGSKSNGTQINFPTPSAGWGTVVGFGVYDASSAGNMLGAAALTASKVINSGDPVYFPASSLTVALD